MTNDERKPCLQGVGLSKVFGLGRNKTVAVDNVNFTFHEGEIVSIVGEAGNAVLRARDNLAWGTQGPLASNQWQLEIEHFWAGALRRAVIDGDVEQGSLMAGQSVGMVTREQPAAEIIAELIAQAEAAIVARQQGGAA